MPRRTRPRLLALVPPAEHAALSRAGGSVGLELTVVDTLTELLEHIAAGPWTATIVSMSVDLVDEAVVERVAAEPKAGSLLLSASGVTMGLALLMQRTGAAAALAEPLEAAEVEARLGSVVAEGPEVPLPAPRESDPGASALVGESRAMGKVFETIARVAGSSVTVLLTGESGTGKEVVARTLHEGGERARGPFVAVNCAAIPEHLLETELFGHERGAFTGAVARRVGRFERAHGGTLFLDEIGDMSLVLQAKVLRVLEERVIERVGGEQTQAVDVRVIAATNQDLRAAVREGHFREDLYHRLAVVELALPPLRERGADVRALALHFAAEFARRYSKTVTGITERALEQLESATWPGNVRELRNVMDRAVLLAIGPTIRAADLHMGDQSPSAAPRGSEPSLGYPPTFSLPQVEADHIRRVLASVGGHMGRAAEVLGIHRNTLTRKLKEHGLEAAATG